MITAKAKGVKRTPSALCSLDQRRKTVARGAILAIGQKKDGRYWVPLPSALRDFQGHFQTTRNSSATTSGQAQYCLCGFIFPMLVHSTEPQWPSGPVVECHNTQAVMGLTLPDDEAHSILDKMDFAASHGTTHIEHTDDI